MAEKNQFNIKIGVAIDQAEAYAEVKKAIALLQAQVNKKKIKVFDTAGAKLYRKELAKVSKDLTAIRGNLKKTGTQSKTAFKQASDGAKDTTKQTKKLGGSLVSAVGKFALWSGIATVFYGAINGMKNLVSTTVQLETEMTNFKIVSNATEEELSQVDMTVNNLVSSLGALKTEVMGASTEFARAGYDMADSMAMAEQAIIGARVGFTSLDNVSTVMISSLKAFNLTAQDSKDVVNDLFVTSKESAVTFEGLGQAIRRSGNSLKTAGASYQQSLALIASANESIQDPATVGSGLKTISARLRGIDKDSNLPKLTQQMREFGVEIENGAGGFRNVYDILDDLQEAFRNSNDEFAKQAVLEELAGKRRANILAGLLNNFSVAQDILKKTTDDINSAEEAQNELLETGAGQVELMKGNWQVFAQAVVNSDGIKNTLSWINDKLKDINTQMTKEQQVGDVKDKLGITKWDSKGIKWAFDYVNFINGSEFKKAQDKLNKLISDGTNSEKQKQLEILEEEKRAYDNNIRRLEHIKILKENIKKKDHIDVLAIKKDNIKINALSNEALNIQKEVEKSMNKMSEHGYTIGTIASAITDLQDALQGVADKSSNVVSPELTAYEQHMVDMKNTSSDTFQAMVSDWEYLTDEMKTQMRAQYLFEIDTISKRIEANKLLITTYESIKTISAQTMGGSVGGVTTALEKMGATSTGSLKLKIDQSIIELNKLKAEYEGLDSSSSSSSKSSFTAESLFDRELRNIEYTISKRKENINQMTEEKANEEIKILKDNLNKKIDILQKEADLQLEVVNNTKLGSEANELASKSYQKLSLEIGKAHSEIYGYNEEIQESIDKAKELANKETLEAFEKGTDDYFDNLEQKYKDDLDKFEKSQEAKIKILDDQLKKLRRTYETSEFEEREERILNKINTLEAEKQKLSLDNSLSAKQRKFEIDEELAEQRINLEDEREQREFDLAENAIEDKKDLINDETDARKDAYDEDMKNLKTYRDEVENLMDDFVINWQNYGINMADAFKKSVLPVINEMNKALGQPTVSGSDIQNGGSGGSSSSKKAPKISSKDTEKIDRYSDWWKKADDKLKAGTYTKEQADRVKQYAHNEAEKVRKKYGYSGGSSGDKYIPVMHSGGIVGGKSFNGLGIDDIMSQLASNETPAILQNGEAVLTERQQSEIANSGDNIGNLINIENLNVQASSSYDVERIGEDLAKGSQRAMSKRGRPNFRQR